jgi:hypothetical protein
MLIILVVPPVHELLGAPEAVVEDHIGDAE